jgi:hypothetical protein
MRARTLVYEYVHPFIVADKKWYERGEGRSFPTPEWVLETLAEYTPNQKKNDVATLDYWQKKGLLRREKTRGLLDISSVATLLIVRLAEGIHQRNWLPTSIKPEEPWWWCYGQRHPGAFIQPLPFPLPAALPASFVLWTPWRGAIWEQEWQLHRDGNLYRWANSPELEDLLVWDSQLLAEIHHRADHPLFGRPAVQSVLLEEARHLVLTDIIQKGTISHEGPPGDLRCESGTD